MSGITFASNIMSLRAQRQLGRTTSDVSVSYRRLASGLRINSAADDAAGLAIVGGLNLNARVFTQASKNLNDGISYFSIAENTIQSMKDILIRQRELATQASSGTLSDTQRKALNTELTQLGEEYNRIMDSAQFNGQAIFDHATGAVALQAGFGSQAILRTNFETTEGLAQNDTVRASVSSSGQQSSGSSGSNPFALALNRDGRFVLFGSDSTNLVSGDANGRSDLFVRDRAAGTTVRANTSTAGVEANGDFYSGDISADGRYVVFSSDATNLVSGDTNGMVDVFIKDLSTGVLTRLTNASGVQGNGHSSNPTMSADGRYVAFVSDATNMAAGTSGTSHTFVKDLVTGAVVLASSSAAGVQGNSDSSNHPSISANGRYVAFNSNASNLVAGDTNGNGDIFVKDIFTGNIVRASTAENGAEATGGASFGPFISADGNKVAFASSSPFFSGGGGINVKDLTTGKLAYVATSSTGEANNGSGIGIGDMSEDGRFVTFWADGTNLVPGDTNGKIDVFIKDTFTGNIARVSVTSAESQSAFDTGSPVMSGDGRYALFASTGTDWVTGDSNGADDAFVVSNSLATWSQVSRNQWISVATQGNAQIAQTQIDNLLTELNGAQGVIGAFQSRLGTALSNLSSLTLNYSAAAGRIQDVDVAQESASLTASQIKQQIASSILGQANAAPQIALDLLKSSGI